MLARNPLSPRQCCRSPMSAGGRGRSCRRQWSISDFRLRDRSSSTRSAFTLVELLIVIIIISMLLALLVPAVTRARTKMMEARVATEIKQLESAVAAFKSRYGVEPPSQFVVFLTPAGWNTGTGLQMKGIIRRIWPQFDFTMPLNSVPNVPSSFPITNWPAIAQTDGMGNPYVAMNAGECLMFFLGGIRGTNGAPIGFSKNPAIPFSLVGTNRDGPFMEFNDVNRIRDSDGNNVPEYFDPIPNQRNPYLYFSSYEGRGYRIAELPQAAGAYTGLHDVYRVFSGSAIVPTPPAAPAASANGSQLLPAQRPQSCQIISPGYDGSYGFGGVFNPDLANSGLTINDDFDNITNFNPGRLVP